jgi:hypothetical protein
MMERAEQNHLHRPVVAPTQRSYPMRCSNAKEQRLEQPRPICHGPRHAPRGLGGFSIRRQPVICTSIPLAFLAVNPTLSAILKDTRWLRP